VKLEKESVDTLAELSGYFLVEKTVELTALRLADSTAVNLVENLAV
jgi:hypothetical protein